LNQRLTGLPTHGLPDWQQFALQTRQHHETKARPDMALPSSGHILSLRN
jgi:hypothetical protein